MAHPNIEERRKYVKQLLDAGKQLTHKDHVEIAKKFNCSHSAIRADTIVLTQNFNSLTHHVSQRLRNKILKRDGKICQYCGSIDEQREYVIEHVIPASIGGVGEEYNLVVACQSCNMRKGNTVWIPYNLDLITINHSEWKLRIIELKDINQPIYPKEQYIHIHRRYEQQYRLEQQKATKRILHLLEEANHLAITYQLSISTTLDGEIKKITDQIGDANIEDDF